MDKLSVDAHRHKLVLIEFVIARYQSAEMKLINKLRHIISWRTNFK
jgi:hypothetical protein